MTLLWPQRLACVTLTLLLLAACGGDEPLTVAGARSSEGVVEVEGYLIERNGELRLCETILESFPPQCGEPSLRVVGAGRAASEERVTLLGVVEDGTLRVVGRA